jgi:hypothetical protein
MRASKSAVNTSASGKRRCPGRDSSDLFEARKGELMQKGELKTTLQLIKLDYL